MSKPQSRSSSMAKRVGLFVPLFMIAALSLSPTFAQDEAKASEAPAKATDQATGIDPKNKRSEPDPTKSLTRQLRVLQKRLNELEKKLDSQGEKQDQLAEDLKKSGDGQGEDDWRVYWRGSVRVENKKKGMLFKIGGRINAEAAFFEGDRSIENARGIEFRDGMELRRARFQMDAVLYKYLEFKAQYEYAGGDTDFRDVYLGIRKIPYIGTIRVGQQKEPFNLEQSGSTNDTPFIERSSASSLNRQRNTGLRVLNTHNKRLHWSIGVYRTADEFGNARDQNSGDYNFTGRIAGLPYKNAEGDIYLHLGFAYSRRRPLDEQQRYRDRPRSNLAPRTVDTGVFAAEYLDLYGAEASLVVGSFNLQGEWVYSFVDGPSGARDRFYGYYVQARFALTGEVWKYQSSDATFTGIDPKKPFDIEKGHWGAFELALRWGYIDLDSDEIRGGKSGDITAALNWYPYRRVRAMFNWVKSNLQGVDELDAFVMRFQIVF